MKHWLKDRHPSSGPATCFEGEPLAIRRCPCARNTVGERESNGVST
jgi:hypothetical protein